MDVVATKDLKGIKTQQINFPQNKCKIMLHNLLNNKAKRMKPHIHLTVDHDDAVKITVIFIDTNNHTPKIHNNNFQLIDK